VYVLALWHGWRERVLAIPLVAVVLNASWELVFGFRHPPERRSARLLYRLWFVLDVALIAQALLWTRGPSSALVLGGFGAAAAMHEYLYRRFRAPAIEAFALNLIMSALFCATLASQGDRSATMVAIAVLKAAGTGVISVANLIDGVAWSRRGRPLLALIPAISILDIAYIVAVMRSPF
jgi:hypothetical protein